MADPSTAASFFAFPAGFGEREGSGAVMLDLATLRSEYLQTGKIPEGVRPAVAQAWERSRAYGIDPEVVRPQAMDPVRLAVARAENPVLLAAAEALLQFALQKLGKGGYVVALSDRHGRILRLITDPTTAKIPNLREFNTVEGASWRESDIGSNGIGTSLAMRQPVVLIGPEHFCGQYQNWTCIGIPLRLTDGEIAGALNISVPNTDVQTANWGWVAAAARHIEGCLRGETVEVIPNPASTWDEGLTSIVGIIELLISQLNLPATHLGFVRDVRLAAITAMNERALTEQRLGESEARFRLLAETMPQLVWTAGADGVPDYYNSRAVQYKGLEQFPDGTWGWQPLLHPDDLQLTVAAWQRALALREVYQVEHRVQMQDGTYRWHLSRAMPFRDAEGKVVKWFGTATEIHDQKRAQELLEQTVAERTAELRDTVDELEHFSYTITHDMRAPLRAMQLFGQILKEEYGARLDDTGRDYLRRITEAAARMDTLVLDALDYSKAVRTQLPLEPIDAGAIIKSIVESYPQFQPPHADIRIVGEFPLVQANAAGLIQCFSNLLGNAVKFVEAGTLPQVKVWAEERENQVRFWIEDNGIGIALEQQQRVFVMFQRLSKKYQGTGVGLALVRKVTERMQGKVGFESEPSQGSRFWLDFRCAASLDRT